MTTRFAHTSLFRHLLIMLVAGLFTLGPALQDAEARRLGGGKSFGTQSRSVQQQPAATQNQAAGTRATQGRAGSRMPGMLGGLLAGGLLAALFFGGAFDELRLMDILVVAGIAFLLFRLLARRRPAVAGGPAPSAEEARGGATAQPFQASGAPLGGAFAGEPTWFDRERFLGGAKEHFMTLQRAWDNNDLAGIQEYVTPELYNLLREERANQPANNRTEVVRLFAELGMVQEVGSQAEATVIFHGILDENGEHNEFNETWHLVRELRDGAPWYVQGIEQNA
ncbi:Predicted lipid-binding transport protein, Tim44 family [Halomonas shengliensis]|uniref:Predicted lipid-binding transport protein, Tim44 family n=1 Tax=Halomonas shengliensis TaxID=419597 RepID=A0A1H0F527_9GAMM|nr:Tim44-like domain-containing protein [Halomonas shengliensis]SDN89760.1 Predicted lipid-binding transport protein, Tim44 family [Halomonas shengliensis]